MVYFGTIGQLYKTTSFLVVSTSFHSEMRKGVGNNKETTSLFFHYYYLTKTCNQGNHSVVKTTNLFLQCRIINDLCYLFYYQGHGRYSEIPYSGNFRGVQFSRKGVFKNFAV